MSFRVVVGDATMLTQLYQTLISNALKFIKDRPPVLRLTVERGANGEWVLGVLDNGIGIEEEFREKIFAPFKRLHARSEYEGTGIGLSIVKRPSKVTAEKYGWNKRQTEKGHGLNSLCKRCSLRKTLIWKDYTKSVFTDG